MWWVIDLMFVSLVIVAFFLGVAGGRSETEERLNGEHAECVQDEYEDGEGQIPSNLVAASAVCGLVIEALDALCSRVTLSGTREETALAAGSFLQAVKMVDDLDLIDYGR